MRQYRGMTKEDKWVTGSLIIDNQGEYVICDYLQYVGGIMDIRLHRVIPETVGQSIGLKDKNGKEIFEGDIIEYVKFLKDETERIVVNFSLGSFNLGGANIYPLRGDINAEIIRTIHDS